VSIRLAGVAEVTATMAAASVGEHMTITQGRRPRHRHGTEKEEYSEESEAVAPTIMRSLYMVNAISVCCTPIAARVT
jgi:hypothetical protein